MYFIIKNIWLKNLTLKQQNGAINKQNEKTTSEFYATLPLKGMQGMQEVSVGLISLLIKIHVVKKTKFASKLKINFAFLSFRFRKFWKLVYYINQLCLLDKKEIWFPQFKNWINESESN